jgi:hypothetical protein
MTVPTRVARTNVPAKSRGVKATAARKVPVAPVAVPAPVATVGRAVASNSAILSKPRVGVLARYDEGALADPANASYVSNEKNRKAFLAGVNANRLIGRYDRAARDKFATFGEFLAATAGVSADDYEGSERTAFLGGLATKYRKYVPLGS